MRLSKEQQDLYAEKILDLGNLSIVGLTFASLLVEKFSIVVFSAGIILLVSCYILGYYIQKGE